MRHATCTMPTYTASLLSVTGDEFSHCENIVVTDKNPRAALDQLEMRFGTKIAFSKRDYYVLRGTRKILYLERYSPEMPKLSDFRNLPEPLPVEEVKSAQVLEESAFKILIFDLAEGQYVLSEVHEVRASTARGALKVFCNPKKGLPPQKPQHLWRRMLHCWLDDDERILFVASSFETADSFKEKLPKPRYYYLELVESSNTTTNYRVEACSPWAAAQYLGECLGTPFENRNHIGALPRYHAADDSAYCVVHFKEIPWTLTF